MELYFSPSQPGFYPGTDRAYYESCGSWPEDAAKLTANEIAAYWRQTPPDGKLLGSVDGRPAWVDIVREPLSVEQMQALRLAAYREESDPLKIEAEHDALIAGATPTYSRWLAKVAEIKARYPLPD